MTIEVKFATIEGAAQDVRKVADDIKRSLDDLEAKVRKVAETWEGEAHEAYLRKQREWDRTAADLHATLYKIAGALGDTDEGYRNIEKQIERMWS